MQQSTAASLSFPAAAKWIAAWVVSMWIAVPAAVHTLLILMALDYATGLLSALMQRELCSAEGLRGLGKKTLTLLLVATAHYLVIPMHLGFDLGATIAAAYSVNEVISITENCAEAGVPIPAALLDVLSRAKRITGRSGRHLKTKAASAGSTGGDEFSR